MRMEGRKDGRKEKKKKYSISSILCINAKKFMDGYTTAQCQTVHIKASCVLTAGDTTHSPPMALS
jgi:hypothetical protein